MGDRSTLIQKSIERAEKLFKHTEQFPKTLFLKKTEPILKYRSTKNFLIQLLDTSLRPSNKRKSNKHIIHILRSYPKHYVLFSLLENSLVWLYKLLGKYFPSISIPLIKNRIRSTTQSVVFNVNGKEFSKLKKVRSNQMVKQNINLIGEALLGEDEAKERIEAYKNLIQHPDIDYISIKISTIYSQISSLAEEQTLNALEPRLTELYNTCLDVEQRTGKSTFINLDMEEYRDLSITVALFKKVLSKNKFKQLYAGIVLQAYIPDSYEYLLDLKQWSNERVKNGGSPIKVRIVKGANMEMEKIESSLKQWELVTHRSKTASDAQYKKMLLEVLQDDSSINIGVASHNIFDISFAIELVKEFKLESRVDFEMLEGLAENLIPVLKQEKLNVLLYTPVVEPKNFLSAMAYLVRRFDEATAQGNYLRESVGMSLNDNNWINIKRQFIDSANLIDSVRTKPFRTRTEHRTANSGSFINSIDTDWTVYENRLWANSIKQRWEKPNNILPEIIPYYHSEASREIIEVESWQGPLPWKYQLATLEDYKNALNKAQSSSWNTYAHKERAQALRQAALSLEQNRSELIGIAITEVGKTIGELDPEISEAIDFANYYASSLEELTQIEHLKLDNSGTNLVLSPWNFPIAIPAGGILASLAVGNTVIIKPAKRSIASAYMLCKTLWDSGIPKDALFFLPTHSCTLSPLLGQGSPFSSIILTGGTETAQTLLKNNPYLNLNAETGGKNATIVTAFADRDLAIKHIVESAFNNAGQKCSATSLLILEKEVYEDQHFINLLIDAANSKQIGTPWNYKTQIGPMANPISDKLAENLNDSSYKSLLQGKANQHYLTPSIVTDVKPSDSCFKEELFGPFLSIIKANDLRHAIELANQTPYGLTSGLQSLNEDEIENWKENIKAGNLYINRGTTGAIVKRQPFGGVKLSSFGAGMKAGGKNYLTQFGEITCTLDKSKWLKYAEKDYKHWFDQLFSKELDDVNIRGQANINRYLIPEKVILLLTEECDELSIRLLQLACKTIGTVLEIHSEVRFNYLENTEYQSPIDWNTIPVQHNIRLRTFNKKKISPAFLERANQTAVHIYDQEILPLGRIELLNYLQEQSISHDFHRYGNLMERG